MNNILRWSLSGSTGSPSRNHTSRDGPSEMHRLEELITDHVGSWKENEGLFWRATAQTILASIDHVDALLHKIAHYNLTKLHTKPNLTSSTGKLQ